jgi:hypothetical protein
MRMGHGRLSEPEGIVIFLAPATVLESLVSRTPGQTESAVGVPAVRGAAAAVGNSGAVGFVAPAAATVAAVGGSV